jgi:uncharacterized membrane protein YciS (DUF1049 family)
MDKDLEFVKDALLVVCIFCGLLSAPLIVAMFLMGQGKVVIEVLWEVGLFAMFVVAWIFPLMVLVYLMYRRERKCKKKKKLK